jgi:GNAT superfamily N-acetyltransferase
LPKRDAAFVRGRARISQDRISQCARGTLRRNKDESAWDQTGAHRLARAQFCVQHPWMDELPVKVRVARPEDARAVARIYVESWHDTYAAILPKRLLCAMTPQGQAARWRAAIGARGREQVMVAESGRHGILGMASVGPARDGALDYDGEVYTLYVDPAFFGRGAGRALLRGGFGALSARGFSSCVIWAHARNPARYFYEAMGGRLVAERVQHMMGDPVPEAAFGWRKLVLAERAAAR